VLGSRPGLPQDEALRRLIVEKKDDAPAAREALLQGADPSAEVDGSPVLCHASREGLTLVVRELLAAGADANGAHPSIPALSCAAATGTVETLQALLDGGADPRARDGTGKTALHWAAERGLSESVRLLLSAGAEADVKTSDGKTASAIAREFQHDEAAREIDSFDRPDWEALLKRATPVPPKTDLARLSRAAADNQIFKLEAGEYPGLVDVRGKSLTFLGAEEGQSVLTGGDEDPVAYVAEKGRLTLVRVTVKPAGNSSVGIVVKDGTGWVSDCRFDAIPESACSAEGGDLTIVRSRFSHQARNAVGGFNGATLTVRRCTFSDGPAAQVLAQDCGSLDVVANRFERVKTGVACRGNSTSVRVRLNRFDNAPDTQPDSVAVSIESPDHAVLAQNRVFRFASGMEVRGIAKAPAQVIGNLFVATPTAILVNVRPADSGVPVTVARNVVYDASSFGICLHATPRAMVANNVVVGVKGACVGLESGSSARFRRNTFQADAAVAFVDSAASDSTFSGDRLFGPVLPSTIGIDLDDVSRSFIAGARGGEKDRLLEAAATVVAAAEAVDPEHLEPLSKAVVGFAGALRAVEAVAARLARLSMHVKDAVGMEVTPSFEVRDAAGPTDSSDGLSPVVASGSGKARWAFVPAGTYWISPQGMPDRVQKVTVEEARELDVEVTAPEALWLRFWRDEDVDPALVTLKPTAKRREMVARLRSQAHHPQENRPLRPGVARVQIDAALALARAELAKHTKPPVFAAGTPEEEQRNRTLEFWNELKYAAQILATAGDASDAKRLWSELPSEEGSREAPAAHVAYLESRLGLLERGELARAAASGDPSAALMLHQYGSPIGIGVLRQALTAPAGTPEPRAIGLALLDDPDPATLEAMRAAWTLRPDSGSLLPVALYLLAYGTPEDWRLIGRRDFHASDARFFIPLAEDPGPLADVLGPLFYHLAHALPALRDCDPGRADAIALAFERSVKRAAARSWASDPEALDPGEALELYHEYASFYRPHKDVANYYFLQGRPLEHLPWAPAVWKKDEVLEKVIANTASSEWEEHLDFIPTETLAKDFEALGADSRPSTRLFLVRHRISTRVFAGLPAEFTDGGVFRPFTFLNAGEGAISGVLEARPQFVEKTLRFSLKFSGVGHYAVNSLFDLNQGVLEKWAHHKYLVNGGTAYIAGFSLRVGDRTLPLLPRGLQRDGSLVFEAALERADLTGVFADLEMEFLGQRRTIVFDLFAGEAARGMRLESARATGVPTGLSLERLGRLQEAWGLYRKDPAAWPGAVDLFSNAGAHDRAAEILGEMLKRSGDPALAADRVTELYLAGSYREAAGAAREALALAPGDSGLKVLRGLCLILAGDWAGADEALASVPGEFQPSRVLPLRLISARMARSPRVEQAQSALRAFVEAQTDPKVKDLSTAALEGEAPAALDPACDFGPQCRRMCYAGYHDLLVAGDAAQARQHWTEAVKSQLVDLSEYRLAQAALKALGTR